MSKRYIGDPHFFHHNIIKYDNRKFNSVHEMNEYLIHNWNAETAMDDEVIICGDFSWSSDSYENRQLLNQLNGRKTLVKGNHDKALMAVRDCFEHIYDYKELMDDDTKVVVFHYPILFWNNQFHDSVHIYAHVHNSHQWNIMESTMSEVRALQALPMRAYNVGCMMPWMKYAPQTLENIISGYNEWAKEGKFDLR